MLRSLKISPTHSIPQPHHTQSAAKLEIPVALRYNTMASVDTLGFSAQCAQYELYGEDGVMVRNVESRPHSEGIATLVRILSLKTYEIMGSAYRYCIPIELRGNMVDNLPGLKQRVVTRVPGLCQVDREYIRASNIPRGMEENYIRVLLDLEMIVPGEVNIVRETLKEVHAEKYARLRNLELFCKNNRDTTDITNSRYFSEVGRSRCFAVPICSFPLCRFHRGYLATAHLRPSNPYPYLAPTNPFNYCPTLHQHYLGVRKNFVSQIHANYTPDSSMALQARWKLNKKIPPATEIFAELADFLAENRARYTFFPFHCSDIWSSKEFSRVFEYKDDVEDKFFYVPKMTYDYRNDNQNAIAFTYPFLNNPRYVVKHPVNAYLTATFGRPKRHYAELGEDWFYASWAIDRGMGQREADGFDKMFTVRGGKWVRPKGSFAPRPRLVPRERIEEEVLDELKMAVNELAAWKKKETAEGRGDARGDGHKMAAAGWYPEPRGDRARVLTRAEAGAAWIDCDGGDDILGGSQMSTPDIRRADEYVYAVEEEEEEEQEVEDGEEQQDPEECFCSPNTHAAPSRPRRTSREAEHASAETHISISSSSTLNNSPSYQDTQNDAQQAGGNHRRNPALSYVSDTDADADGESDTEPWPEYYELEEEPPSEAEASSQGQPSSNTQRSSSSGQLSSNSELSSDEDVVVDREKGKGPEHSLAGYSGTGDADTGKGGSKRRGKRNREKTSSGDGAAGGGGKKVMYEDWDEYGYEDMDMSTSEEDAGAIDAEGDEDDD